VHDSSRDIEQRLPMAGEEADTDIQLAISGVATTARTRRRTAGHFPGQSRQ
jgi:hypothetical protein